MNQKLSHHVYRSSLIGLLSTSVLLTMAVGGATAASHPKQATVPSSTVTRPATHGQLTTKEVVRTISYVDPLTKQEHTIHQVARYQFDRQGQLVKSSDPIWPAYFVPVFAGYAPNRVEIPPKLTSPDAGPENERIAYTKLPERLAASTAQVMFTTVDGKVIDWQFPSVVDAAGQTVATFNLPTPPAGWEYVNGDQLPATLRITPGTANAFTFFVQKKAIQHESKPVSQPETKQETKQLLRKIVLHLPAGDQVVTQHATATRRITVKDGKTTYGKWQIGSFDELQLAPMAGYQTSTDRIAALCLTPDQLDQELPAIEVQYHKLTSDEGTNTSTTSDAATMTDPIPMTDAGSQTTSSTQDEGSQTTVPTTSERGIQTDAVTGVDADTQTAVSDQDEENQTDVVTEQNASTQTTAPATNDGSTQTDPVAGHDVSSQTENTGKNAGSQTDMPATSEGGTQTDVVAGKDEGSQTATPETTVEGTQTDLNKDAGNQTDAPTVSDGSTQTDVVAGKNEGSQTATPETAVEGTQTDLSKDAGNQTDAPATSEDGTQTEVVTGRNANTQTPTPTTSEGGTQTDVVTNQDTSTQTATSSQDAGSQTDDPTGQDTGTQTMAPATSAESTQTDAINDEDAGTQTEQPHVTTTGSQTAEHSTVDTGVGDDSVSDTDRGSQTDNVTTVDAGVGDDRVSGVDQATQTHQEPLVDAGVGNDDIGQDNQATQTEQATTVDTGSGEGTATAIDRGSQTDPSHTVSVAVGDDPVNTADQATQTDTPTTVTTGTGDKAVTVVDQATQTEPATDTTTVDRVSQGTQTVPDPVTAAGHQGSNTDRGTQTAETDAPDDSNDHHRKGVDQGTQTELTTLTTATVTADSNTQTPEPLMVDTGVGNDTIGEVTPSTTASQDTPSGMVTSDEPTTPTGASTNDQPTNHVDLASQSVEPSLSQPATGEEDRLAAPTPAPTALRNTPANDVDPVAFHTELDRLQQPLRKLAAHPGQLAAHSEGASLPQTGNEQAAGGLTLVGLLTSLLAAGMTMLKLKGRP